MNGNTLENFKASDAYKVAMTNLVATMDTLMQFARSTGCTHEEAIEFTKRELNEFIEKLDKK
jgi:hypothetical protein